MKALLKGRGTMFVAMQIVTTLLLIDYSSISHGGLRGTSYSCLLTILHSTTLPIASSVPNFASSDSSIQTTLVPPQPSTVN